MNSRRYRVQPGLWEAILCTLLGHRSKYQVGMSRWDEAAQRSEHLHKCARCRSLYWSKEK